MGLVTTNPMLRSFAVKLIRCLILPSLCLAVLCAPAVAAGAKSTVKEYDQVFTTYPYSDPDPVPTMSRFYPFFRYDAFTDKPIQKKWKVVELSNDYLQILILPEIGGKVWAAIDNTEPGDVGTHVEVSGNSICGNYRPDSPKT